MSRFNDKMSDAMHRPTLLLGLIDKSVKLRSGNLAVLTEIRESTKRSRGYR
jgi:hypothetical protein